MEKRFAAYEDGELYRATVLVVSSALPTSSKGTTFGRYKFKNLLKESIDGMQWNVNSIDEFPQNKVVDIVGKVQVYNGRKSVIIQDVRLNQELEPDDFNFVSPMSEETAQKEFKTLFNSIESNNLKLVVKEVISKIDGYFTSVAAQQNHHDFKGGLAYHSITMAQVASKLCEVYPKLNRDLLISGALIHDSGKTIELLQGDEKGYTTPGKLFGHIIIVNDLLQEVLFEHPELKEDNNVALLKHMLLSHHGKLDWGSPVVGLIPEAIILHHIDKIDADLMMAMTALDGTVPGEFTQKVWPLENRSLLNPGEDKILDY